MGFLDTIFGGNETAKAGKKNAAALDALNTRGQGYINTAAGASRDYLGQVPGLYDPYVSSGAAARSTLDDALGLNGQAGSNAARAAFRTGPGYDFTVDESMRAAERAASAGGMLASGNTLIELQNRGASLADQEFDNWLDRMFATSGQGLTAAGAKGGAIKDQAALEQDILAQRLGLDVSVTSGLNNNRNNVAAAKEKGVDNALGLVQKFTGFL